MHHRVRVVADPAKDEPPPIVIYSSSMDLCSCDIDDLRQVYLLKGGPTMRYQDLYDAILKRQAEGDRTGSIILPTPRVSLSSPSKSPVDGFVCRLQPDPTLGKAHTVGTYEIIVQCLEAERRLIFRLDEITFFPCPNSVVLKAGVSAAATDRAEGVLKMTRIWEGKDGQELFEGFFSFGETRKWAEMTKTNEEHGSWLSSPIQARSTLNVPWAELMLQSPSGSAGAIEKLQFSLQN
ncbi:hypothetical protein GLOTRDRAFT_133759 [Gloeophyllum trabeum ATCC 11539]|uniref:Uncharacterized protein n=1 Tax=Gloeophyllum trabeum (strain ATCC 11539 / FP-39264 / Madison 617) TaxID=670483 RepID=S7PTA5_GLOTA|nr:uncharacterized protein GLOTRDRAFT_133759 [Gloeophyllum trabeum ATCC 11539]EPQ50648.1 hypothetical protein GLOTRDRAFT_133759 [Gloeophyllum trabeum ATCC 11539]